MIFFFHQNINLDVYFHLVEHRLSKIIVIKFKSSIYLPWLQLECFASELWGDWTSPIACRSVSPLSTFHILSTLRHMTPCELSADPLSPLHIYWMPYLDIWLVDVPSMYCSMVPYETDWKSSVQTSLLDNWTNDKIELQAPGSKIWFRNDGSLPTLTGNGRFFAISTPVILRTS